MKIGVIPPVPMEPFLASAHEVTNLWSTFFLGPDRRSWVETAHMAGFPENYSLWAKSLYGMVFEMGLEAVYYPEPGLPKEVQRVIQLLREQEVRTEPFNFPLLRNPERLKAEMESLCSRLRVEPAALESGLERCLQVRTTLRRYDGLQQRTGAFSSKDYLTMLTRCMDPRGDFEATRKEIERGILDYQDVGRDRWVRIGLLGLTPYRERFYDALERLRAVVVYDEWGVENNPMAAASDLTSLYHLCSLPYGLKRRLERTLREAQARKVRGFILSVEYLCESVRDEGFFRANLGMPVHTLESRGGAPLSPAEESALQRFLALCGSGA